MTGPLTGAGPVGLAVTRSVVRTAAVLTAAGSGSRLGHPVPKALAPLDGIPLVAHAAGRLIASGVVDLLVVTTPAGHLDDMRVALESALGPRPPVPVECTVGGPSRQASVAVALARLPADVDVVLVHDAARALAPASLVADVVAAVRAGHGAVIPALPVTDTVVQVAPVALPVSAAVRPGPVSAGSAPTGSVSTGSVSVGSVTSVVSALDRSVLRLVQTPQGFDRALLDRAHFAASARAADEAQAATDDSSLVALLGEPVVSVPGHELALKITTPRDLLMARLLLGDAGEADSGSDGVPALQPSGGTP